MQMNAAADPLASIRIASPCQADWSRMEGDDRTRFCRDCKLSVHDLSAMTRDEAMQLLRDAGQGRLCVRFHRRADGTVLTRDCPVGLRQRLRWAWARAAALVAALWSGVACSGAQPVDGAGSGSLTPTPATTDVPPTMGSPVPPPPVLQGEVEMGDVAMPAPPADGAAIQGRVAPGDRR